MNAIALLNDRFRQGDMSLGQYNFTQGVQALAPEKQQQLIQLVQDFNCFNLGNDPYTQFLFNIVDKNVTVRPIKIGGKST